MAFNKSLLTLALSNLRPKHYVMHDWALALLAAYTGRLIFVDECLSLYRQHGGNILGAGRKKSLFEYMVRANRLSTAVLEQVTAFEEDLDRAVNRRKRIGPLVPGIGPLRWRLASVYLAKGPTLGHRFAAIFPLIKRTASSRLHFRPGGDAIQDEGFSDQYSVGSKLDTIAILGSRGIPARYGGFETLAEQLAAHLNPADVPLAIYGQRSAYSKAERLGEFRGHARRWMPFSASGAQSMLHDALQLGHAALIGRYRNILLLGTSAAWALPTVRLFRPSARVICNIDGLEWRREKFGPFAKAVLKILEAVAVHFSDAVIADNNALAPIVRSRYGVEPIVIAYGGDHIEVLGKGSDPAGYALAIARIEPENNSAMILEGAQQAGFPIHFVGNWTASAYGRELLASYSGAPGCVMEPATYDQGSLAKIRSGSSVYIHGHSVGGTNPSLVEALFHSKRILAFDCSFNRATLEDEGRYFSSAEGLAKLLDDPTSGLIPKSSLLRLRKKFQWSSVSRQYAELFAGNTKSIDCA
jgi:glycosyltransferase involved in cell wall biosynthesis